MESIFTGMFIVFLGLGALIRFFPRTSDFLKIIIYNDLKVDSTGSSKTNKAILNYAEKNGNTIAPTYKQAVCTEYIIQIVSHFKKLSKKEKKVINVITNKDIESLLAENSPVTKGVYTALVNSGARIPVDNIDSVKAGDLVQFWDTFNSKRFGHCGIVRTIDMENGLINVYSSTPSTNGHGRQTYFLTKYMYFFRLK